MNCFERSTTEMCDLTMIITIKVREILTSQLPSIHIFNAYTYYMYFKLVCSPWFVHNFHLLQLLRKSTISCYSIVTFSNKKYSVIQSYKLFSPISMQFNSN